MLAKIDSVACPFTIVKKYVQRFNIDLSSSNYIFRAMYTASGHTALRHKVKKLSYTRTKEVILGRLQKVAPAGLNLGLHSLRASGVTAAAAAGVDERLYKRHGRWRSDAVHGYVKDSVNSRLSVSKSLGL